MCCITVRVSIILIIFLLVLRESDESMVWVFSIYVVSLNTWFFLLIWFGSVAFLAVEMAHYFSMTHAACLLSMLFFSFHCWYCGV